MTELLLEPFTCGDMAAPVGVSAWAGAVRRIRAGAARVVVHGGNGRARRGRRKE